MIFINNYKKLHEDLKNKIYNELQVLEFVEKGKYKFICSCGKECIKRMSDVKSGKTKSCGHISESRKLNNYVGYKFNKLKAIKDIGIINKNRNYIFKCECGKEITRELKEVKRGKIKSCGCGVVESVKKANTTHGMSGTRLYNIWVSMKKRCKSESCKHYNHYGGRGIKVCEEWENEFLNFYNWAINNGYAENLTIDRINVNGNYEAKNCRWITINEQANNKTNTKYVTLNNVTKTLKDWCEELELNFTSVHKRINTYNYSGEKALTYKTEKIKAKVKFY